jgi:hypothetical protein
MPFALCVGLACYRTIHRIANDFLSSPPLFSSRRRKSIVLTENGVSGDFLSLFLLVNAVAVPAAIVQATAQCPFLTIKKSFRLSWIKWGRIPLSMRKEVKVKELVPFNFLGA